MANNDSVLSELMKVIRDRKENPSEKSYTNRLLDGGVDKIGEKILEESAEVIEAAHTADDEKGRDHVAHEAADLLYHLLVMLGHCDVELSSVEAKLADRFGISGLEEKANRKKKPDDESSD
ncbi:MAG: phosphoribosyl-ATP diphosphatase [Planctomycetota bacterium]